MEIDFKTGKVIYTDCLNEDPEQIRQSLEEMKIKNNAEEPVFSKTIHSGLPYGRLKYLFYCFLINDGWFDWYCIIWSDTKYYG